MYRSVYIKDEGKCMMCDHDISTRDVMIGVHVTMTSFRLKNRQMRVQGSNTQDRLGTQCTFCAQSAKGICLTKSTTLA